MPHADRVASDQTVQSGCFFLLPKWRRLSAPSVFPFPKKKPWQLCRLIRSCSNVSSITSGSSRNDCIRMRTAWTDSGTMGGFSNFKTKLWSHYRWVFVVCPKCHIHSGRVCRKRRLTLKSVSVSCRRHFVKWHRRCKPRLVYMTKCLLDVH